MNIFKSKKFINALVSLFLCLFFQTINADTLQKNKILSNLDITLYKQIFAIQDISIKNRQSPKWKTVNKLIKKLDNKILLGNVFAERYLHPTGWRSSFKELKQWLDKYSDHPDATRIYRIAIKRKPKNHKNPKKPTKGFLNGYGLYKSNVLKPKFPMKKGYNKYSRHSYLISRKVRKAINKRKAQFAEKLLNSKINKKYLTKEEQSQLRAELAHAYFIFNYDELALRQSRLSLSLSYLPNPLALWAGGLASWRRNDLKSSKYFFNILAEKIIGPEGIIAGGGYWSARIAYNTGNAKKANYFLSKAATHERTFYGSLAMESLGYKYKPDFSLPEYDLNFIKKIKLFKGGLRALALLEVSEYHKSAREFRKIIPQFEISDYPKLVSFASKNNMPGLTFRLAAILRNNHNKLLLGGLYPIPNWKTEISSFKEKALIYSIVRQESGFNPRAKSSSKALGIMQIMPSTAAFIMKNRAYKLKGSKNHLLYEPTHSIHIGSKYMKFLLNLPLINQDLMWMLASYNAGPGNFKKWTKDKDYKISDTLLMLESLPARETRNYIKLVLTNLWIYKLRFNQKSNILSALAAGKPINFKVFFKH